MRGRAAKCRFLRLKLATKVLACVKAKLVHDILPDALRRRGGKGQADGLGQAAAHREQLAILRPKIVAPLRDAVRLVNGQALDAALVQHHERFRSQQRLGRGVEQLDLSLPDALHGLHVAAIVQTAVKKRRRHAQLAQLVHLVLHQRDQRRDDQGQAVEDQRRQLITQRLTAAGGHDGQRVPPLQHVVDDLGLQRPEGVVAENGLEEGGGGGWSAEWGVGSGEQERGAGRGAGSGERRGNLLWASPSPNFRTGELGSGVLGKADSGGEGAENWGSSAANGLEAVAAHGGAGLGGQEVAR